MICPNCGGEYAQTDLSCPFCQRENELVAERNKQAKINQLEQEKKEIKELPKRRLHKSAKALLAIGISAAGMLLIIIIGIACFIRLNSERKYDRETTYLTALEDFYQEKNLEGLYQYVEENDIYGSRYEKYTIAAKAYEYYISLKEEISYLHTLTQQEYSTDAIYAATSDGIRICRLCKEGIDVYGAFDNVEPMQTLYDDSVQILVEELYFFPEEIEKMCVLEEINKDTLKQYCEAACAARKETE